MKIPWYLETNDPSQAVLTGPFRSQAIGVTDVSLRLHPQAHQSPPLSGIPEGPPASLTILFMLEHDCETQKKRRVAESTALGQRNRLAHVEAEPLQGLVVVG